MTAELDKKLCEKYPKIFAQRNMDETQTAMCWGFSCGDGWFTLIDVLCSSIQNTIENDIKHNKYIINNNKMIEELKRGDTTTFDEIYGKFSPEYIERNKQQLLNKEPSPVKEIYQVVAVQVKEKFGGLRFYVDGASSEIYAMISFAENMSYHICEQCGTTTNVTTGGKGWISTLCDSCRK